MRNENQNQQRLGVNELLPQPMLKVDKQKLLAQPMLYKRSKNGIQYKWAASPNINPQRAIKGRPCFGHPAELKTERKKIILMDWALFRKWDMMKFSFRLWSKSNEDKYRIINQLIEEGFEFYIPSKTKKGLVRLYMKPRAFKLKGSDNSDLKVKHEVPHDWLTTYTDFIKHIKNLTSVDVLKYNLKNKGYDLNNYCFLDHFQLSKLQSFIFSQHKYSHQINTHDYPGKLDQHAISLFNPKELIKFELKPGDSPVTSKFINHLLDSAPKLNELILDQLQTKELRILSCFPKLKNPRIHYDHLKSLSVNANLSRLTKLYIFGSKELRFYIGQRMGSLKKLLVRGCSSLIGIENLPNLEELYVGNGRLTRIPGLNKATKLKIIDIKLCLDLDLETRKTLQALRAKGVDVRGLESNEKMRKLFEKFERERASWDQEKKQESEIPLFSLDSETKTGAEEIKTTQELFSTDNNSSRNNRKFCCGTIVLVKEELYYPVYRPTTDDKSNVDTSLLKQQEDYFTPQVLKNFPKKYYLGKVILPAGSHQWHSLTSKQVLVQLKSIQQDKTVELYYSKWSNQYFIRRKPNSNKKKKNY